MLSLEVEFYYFSNSLVNPQIKLILILNISEQQKTFFVVLYFASYLIDCSANINVVRKVKF